MENNDSWSRARNVGQKSAEQIEEEAERRDKLSEEVAARERAALEAREKEEEILSQPAKTLVTKTQLRTFLSKGEVGISNLDFGDRVLNPGDVIILVDEQNKEWPVELVSIEKTNTGNDRIKVKSPENK
ncbi:MAG: hypothetical protein UX71_C0010G0013 [Parcubacteria group bacterium GW2011_GWA1_47_10]|nr:MAG: hypothetical protein UX71_C0010G0013 [Parcubacteria group bacterium GW2011_GWA1_47_10]